MNPRESSDAAIVVATNTHANGDPATGTSDFTTTAAAYAGGDATATSQYWTDANLSSMFGATQAAHLYCFGTGESQGFSLTPQTGRMAFLTLNPSAAISRAQADAHCQTEAGGLASSHPGAVFLALVATTTESAAQRFAAGDPWVRPDGMPWVDKVEDLTAGRFSTALNVTPDGAYGQGWLPVWTGSTGVGQPSLGGAQNCGDWASAGGCTSGPTTLYGLAEFAGAVGFNFNGITRSCGCTDGRLYCLEK
jgi:hypothetical protein